jgi:hypothetical protein
LEDEKKYKEFTRGGVTVYVFEGEPLYEMLP